METREWLFKIFLILSIARYCRVYIFCSALGENKLKISFSTLEVHKLSSIVINFMRFTIALRNVMQNRVKFQVLLITFQIQKKQRKGNFSHIRCEMFHRYLYILTC